MNRNLIRIPTTNMSHEDWLKHRMESIGGSDAAGILGMNAYSSPYSVWADKTGRTAPKEDNEAMRLGRDLEDYVAKRFTEATGKKVRRENFILRNPDIPFAHANVDRLVIGEDAGLECKTTSVLNLKKFKNGEFPENYYVQCVHYLAVTGAKRWYLAVLVLGQGFYWFVIERDDAEIKALLQEEEAFWNLVTTDTPPFADGSKATTEALKEVYAISTEAIADLSSFNSDLRTYARLSAQIKALEKDLLPILCVGESLEQREAGITMDLITIQIKKAFKDIAAADAKKVVVAYEPIWAIGTGKTATADQAEEVCAGIRKVLASLYDDATAAEITIQYGGSMNAANAAELLAKANIDGGLIGGASLKSADFATIVAAAK